MTAKKPASPVKAYLALNLACLLWAGNIVVGRALAGLVGPWTIVTGRSLISVLLFAILLQVLRRNKGSAKAEPALGSDWFKLLLMSLTGVAGYQAALYFGVRSTTAINASLIHAAAPLVTIILAWAMVGARVNRWQWAGSLCSLTGIGFLVGQGRFSLGSIQFNGGDLLIVLAMLLWALFSILSQGVMKKRSVVSSTALVTLFALFMVLPAGVWEISTSSGTLSGWAVAGISYTALGAGVLAFLSWNYGVKELGAATAMIFINLSPVYSVLLAMLFLGEKPGTYHLVGALLVLGGCFVALIPPARIARAQS